MSHKVNDELADNKIDMSDWWEEQEQLQADRMEEVYDNSYEPTCGIPEPAWAH